MLLPQNFSGDYVDGVDVIVDAGFDGDLFGTVFGGDRVDDEGREERVHLMRDGIELEFPEDFEALDVGGVEDFFVALPIGAFGIAAVGGPLGAPG